MDYLLRKVDEEGEGEEHKHTARLEKQYVVDLAGFEIDVSSDVRARLFLPYYV